MHRIDGPGALPGGLFTDGDPTLGTPSTIVTEDWANAVQGELVNAILGAGIALSKPDNTQLLQAIQRLAELRLPAGAVQAFAMNDVPPGWLACNGQLVSRTAYGKLFAAIGTLYGAGDGVSTFGLPDYRGEFLRGLDNARGVDAGRTIGTSQAGSVQAHTHTLPETIVIEDGGAGGPGGSTSGTASIVGPTGSFGGAETRPRNVAVLYCIRT